MELKLLGAILIVAGCGGYGFSLCTRYRKRERALSDLVRALDRMECELQYRLTPLPELCRGAAMQGARAFAICTGERRRIQEGCSEGFSSLWRRSWRGE